MITYTELKDVMLRCGDDVESFKRYGNRNIQNPKQLQQLLLDTKSVTMFSWLFERLRDRYIDIQFQVNLIRSHLNEPQIIQFLVENQHLSYSGSPPFSVYVIDSLLRADPTVCSDTLEYFLNNNIIIVHENLLDSFVTNHMRLVNDNGTQGINFQNMVHILIQRGYKLTAKQLIQLIIHAKNPRFTKFLIDSGLLNEESGFSTSMQDLNNRQELVNRLLMAGNDPSFWMLVRNGILTDRDLEDDSTNFLINVMLQTVRKYDPKNPENYNSYVRLFELLLQHGFKYKLSLMKRWLTNKSDSNLVLLLKDDYDKSDPDYDMYIHDQRNITKEEKYMERHMRALDLDFENGILSLEEYHRGIDQIAEHVQEYFYHKDLGLLPRNRWKVSKNIIPSQSTIRARDLNQDPDSDDDERKEEESHIQLPRLGRDVETDSDEETEDDDMI